jgi:hypothetical protein
MKEPTTEQWHMKKEFNLVHVIMTLSFFVSGSLFLGDLDKRISANEQSIIYVQTLRTEDQKRLEKNLDGINEKLDRLLENR